MRFVVANLFALIAFRAFEAQASRLWPTEGHISWPRTWGAISVSIVAFVAGYLLAMLLTAGHLIHHECRYCGTPMSGKVKCGECGLYAPLGKGWRLIGLGLVLGAIGGFAPQLGSLAFGVVINVFEAVL